LLSFALGVIGIPPSEFYDLTMFEYICICEGYKKREANEWDRVRTLGFYIIKAAGDTKMNSPKDILHISILDGEIDSKKNSIKPALMKKLMEAKLKAQGNGSRDVAGIKNTDTR